MEIAELAGMIVFLDIIRVNNFDIDLKSLRRILPANWQIFDCSLNSL